VVERVDELKRKAIRRLDFEYSEPVPASLFAGVEGVRTAEVHDAPAPGCSPSQWTIGRTIGARAVADRVTVVGVLAFYSLAMGAGVGALWPP
jgi:hypothetical protein